MKDIILKIDLIKNNLIEITKFTLIHKVHKDSLHLQKVRRSHRVIEEGLPPYQCESETEVKVKYPLFYGQVFGPKKGRSLTCLVYTGQVVRVMVHCQDVRLYMGWAGGRCHGTLDRKLILWSTEQVAGVMVHWAGC